MEDFHPLNRPLRGVVTMTADKSIAQRALMLAAIAEGETRIDNLPATGAVASTLHALRTMGVRIDLGDPAADGSRPACIDGWAGMSIDFEEMPRLHCGDSGATARMLCGLLAGAGMSAHLDAGEQLSRRPMDRVLAPLLGMGVGFDSMRFPFTLYATNQLNPVFWELPVASAQVKSALLLAALGAQGESVIREPALSRDHTERLLRAMGVDLESTVTPDGHHELRIYGPAIPDASLLPQPWVLPGDPSSAAFLAVAAALLPGSDISIDGVALNPTRIAFAHELIAAGVDLQIEYETEVAGESVGSLRVRCANSMPQYAPLRVEAAQVPSLIDELPVLALFATACQGESVFRSVAELRVKESDRLQGIIDGLSTLGCHAWLDGDDLHIAPGTPTRSATFDP
ncbi:MAG: hypothetical protein IJJ14_03260, partial [Coriobacteriales bacterium]|nr:hypothetical protein [Coriobacteriales bacterium]